MSEPHWEVVQQIHSAYDYEVSFDVHARGEHFRITVSHAGFPIGIMVERAVS